tara:strand:- start:1675 stop:2352 length:678 start_codon:yes stop_codon:yes gene_type:complete
MSYPVAHSSESARQAFIRKTYLNLLLAVGGFVGLEVFLFSNGLAQHIFGMLLSVNWLIVLAGFMGLTWLANRFASPSASKPQQYMGLSLSVILHAIIFVPVLSIAQLKTGGGAIESAALATGLGFSGLSFIAFSTKTDFSFLGKAIMFACIGAVVLIACSAIFGFSLGVLFSVGMVIVAGMAILYNTSNIIHHYPEDAYIAASLSLFASVAMMFFYLLNIFSSRD